MNHPLRGKTSSTLPRFSRLNYFYGQVIGHHDLADEQRYWREKLRLHNRCLHGWGVVCGLRVTIVEGPVDPCYAEVGADPESLRERADALVEHAKSLEKTAATLDDREAAEAIQQTVAKLHDQVARLRELAAADPRAIDRDPCTRPKVRVSPGVALDRYGRELVLAQPLEVDLWAALSEDDRRRLSRGEASTVHVSLCYCEAGLGRVRPVVPNPCGPVADNYARILEGVRLELRVDAAPIEELCNPCCEDRFASDCVPLARLVGVRFDRRGRITGRIDERWRRHLAVYEPVRVTGISWEHGQTYAPARLTQLLGRSDTTGPERGVGLELRFSRPVRADSFAPGVFEVLRYAGGGAPSGGLAWIAFEPERTGAEFVDRIVYRQATNERWSPGDKILIRLRSEFVLDACCVALDGTHVGGRVPQIEPESPPASHSESAPAPSLAADRRPTLDPKYPVPPDYPAPANPSKPVDACAESPRRVGPWTSGVGTPGGDFVSWIFAS